MQNLVAVAARAVLAQDTAVSSSEKPCRRESVAEAVDDRFRYVAGAGQLSGGRGLPVQLIENLCLRVTIGLQRALRMQGRAWG